MEYCLGSASDIIEGKWCLLSPVIRSPAEPHTSVGSIADLKIGGHWFDPQLGHSFPGLMIVITTGFIPLTAVHCFDNGYVGKQPAAWKEYCAEY